MDADGKLHLKDVFINKVFYETYNSMKSQNQRKLLPERIAMIKSTIDAVQTHIFTTLEPFYQSLGSIDISKREAFLKLFELSRLTYNTNTAHTSAYSIAGLKEFRPVVWRINLEDIMSAYYIQQQYPGISDVDCMVKLAELKQNFKWRGFDSHGQNVAKFDKFYDIWSKTRINMPTAHYMLITEMLHQLNEVFEIRQFTADIATEWEHFHEMDQWMKDNFETVFYEQWRIEQNPVYAHVVFRQDVGENIQGNIIPMPLMFDQLCSAIPLEFENIKIVSLLDKHTNELFYMVVDSYTEVEIGQQLLDDLIVFDIETKEYTEYIARDEATGELLFTHSIPLHTLAQNTFSEMIHSREDLSELGVGDLFQILGNEPEHHQQYERILGLIDQMETKYPEEDWGIAWGELIDGFERYGDYAFINKYLQGSEWKTQPIMLEFLGYGKDNELTPAYMVKKLITYTLLQWLGVPVVLIADPADMKGYLDYFPLGTLMVSLTEWQNIVKYAVHKKQGNIVAALSDYSHMANTAYTGKDTHPLRAIEYLNELHPESPFPQTTSLNQLSQDSFFVHYDSIVQSWGIISMANLIKKQRLLKNIGNPNLQ